MGCPPVPEKVALVERCPILKVRMQFSSTSFFYQIFFRITSFFCWAVDSETLNQFYLRFKVCEIRWIEVDMLFNFIRFVVCAFFPQLTSLHPFYDYLSSSVSWEYTCQWGFALISGEEQIPAWIRCAYFSFVAGLCVTVLILFSLHLLRECWKTLNFPQTAVRTEPCPNWGL